MSPGDFIAKVLLWGYIRVKGIEKSLGRAGHSLYTCGMRPWDPPAPGPWMEVCSPRICPEYDECLKMVAHWTRAQELVDYIDLDSDLKDGLGWYRG